MLVAVPRSIAFGSTLQIGKECCCPIHEAFGYFSTSYVFEFLQFLHLILLDPMEWSRLYILGLH